MRKLYTKKEEKILKKYGVSESTPELVERFKGKRSYKSVEKKLTTLGVKRDPATYKKAGRKSIGKTKTISGEALYEKIIKIAEASFKKSPIVKKSRILKISKKKHKDEVALLLFSDSHIGKKTATYNPQVFSDRMEKLKKATMSIISALRSIRNIKKLIIVFNGDIIDAESIYPSQSVDGISATVLDQIFRLALPELNNFLLFCLDNFEEVECYCVRGNHGNLNASKWSSSKSTNWDLVVYKMLEAITSNQPRLKWHIAEKDWKILFKVFNHGFLACHGDMIRSYMNLPFYGMIRQATRWQSAYRNKMDIDSFLFSHFHSANAGTRFNQINIYVNGSFITDDEFAEEKLGVSSVPEQLLLGVHPTYGVTWRYILRL